MQPDQAPSAQPGAGAPPAGQAQQHLAYMQQYQQAQLRQQVAYMQQAMMAYPGASPYPVPPYPGAAPYMGGMGMMPPQVGFGGPGFGGGKGGDGKGKGKFGFGKGGFGKGFGGKGKKGGSKGGKSKGKGDDDADGEGGEAGEGEEDTERAPRVRKDENPFVKAQREARERAEGMILKKLQGRWVDKADENITYTVEGNTCSVATKGEDRVFHNRLSMYGVEFCWNAKRFWHDVNLKALQSSEEPVETVEWNPGKSSPPAEQIVWLRAPPEPEKEEADATDEGQNAAGATPAAEECSAPAAESTDAPADA